MTPSLGEGPMALGEMLGERADAADLGRQDDGLLADPDGVAQPGKIEDPHA